MSGPLKTRTKEFALRIIRLAESLDNQGLAARTLAKQLLRSGTSVGAHYRESQRARSKREMISKLEGGQQELDETQYWIELLTESQIVAPEKLLPLYKESDEIMAMLIASIRTLKKSEENLTQF